ncbi:MAG: helix-turn-helix domain-containing protein [Eubacteriales bacterium]|nr:helix-turn-helix domain-containing protein [Eubacteriales bacterium]
MNVNAVDTWAVPVIDLIATGQNIKNLRVSAGISVRDLQDIFGFTNPQSIYKWQNGDSMPTVDNLVILASVFGVTVDEIIVVGNSGRCDAVIDTNSPVHN